MLSNCCQSSEWRHISEAKNVKLINSETPKDISIIMNSVNNNDKEGYWPVFAAETIWHKIGPLWKVCGFFYTTEGLTRTSHPREELGIKCNRFLLSFAPCDTATGTFLQNKRMHWSLVLPSLYHCGASRSQLHSFNSVNDQWLTLSDRGLNFANEQ